jgi:hypothetical protein
MNLHDDEQNQLNVSELIRESIAIYRQAFPVLISYGLLHGLASLLPHFAFQKLGIKSMEVAMFLSLLLASYVVVALMYACLRVIKGKDVNIQKTFDAARKRYWDFVGVHFTYILIIFGGFLLLIIPGIYFATIFIFAELVTVLERRGFLDSFRRSTRLVKYHFQKVLFFSMGLILILFVPVYLIENWMASQPMLARSLSVMIQVFIVPYYMVAEMLLFSRLREIHKRLSFEDLDFSEESEDV